MGNCGCCGREEGDPVGRKVHGQKGAKILGSTDKAVSREWRAGSIAGLPPWVGTVIIRGHESKSREWILGHVRAGKEVFCKEIEEAGLKLVEEVKIDGLKENYCLRFRKE